MIQINSASFNQITFTCIYQGSLLKIPSLELHLLEQSFKLSKKDCLINIPYRFVSSVGKNKLSLMAFLLNPDAEPLPSYCEDIEQDQQDVVESQSDKNDMIMFKMLQKINEGIPFMNTLKGNFTIQVDFLSQVQLTACRTILQKKIAESQTEISNSNNVEMIEEEEQINNQL